jgi:hypothetical protein
MKVGGERLLVIPPTLGYGSQDVKDPSGKVIIPSNSLSFSTSKLVDAKAGSLNARNRRPLTALFLTTSLDCDRGSVVLLRG